MKKRVVFAIVIVLALLGALLWWRSGTNRKASPHESVGSVEATQAERGRLGTATTAASVDGSERADAGTLEEVALAPLDCDAPEGNVATVDDQGISAAEFCQDWRRLSGPTDRGDPVVMDAQGKALLAQMIDSQLVQRALATANRAVTDSEVDAALDELIAKRAAATPLAHSKKSQRSSDPRKAFDDSLRASGSDLGHVRAELRQRAGLRRLIELRGNLEPTAPEIEAAYAADPTRWGTPRSATVEGFLARATPTASAETRAQALATAQAFAEEVASGAPEQLATSRGLTRMPPFEVTAYGVEPQLAETAFGLAPGQWSQPLSTRAGWLVMRQIKTQPGLARPLAEVRDQVRLMLTNQHKLHTQQQLLAELRAQAKIVYLQW